MVLGWGEPLYLVLAGPGWALDQMIECGSGN